LALLLDAEVSLVEPAGAEVRPLGRLLDRDLVVEGGPLGSLELEVDRAAGDPRELLVREGGREEDRETEEHEGGGRPGTAGHGESSKGTEREGGPTDRKAFAAGAQPGALPECDAGNRGCIRSASHP